MADDYKIWKVIYRYNVDSGDKMYRTSEEYLVIETTEAKAMKKADQSFSHGEKYLEELLLKGKSDGGGVSLYNLNKSIKKYNALVKFPNLSEEDLENFILTPKLSKDKKSLEFIIKKSI